MFLRLNYLVSEMNTHTAAQGVPVSWFIWLRVHTAGFLENSLTDVASEISHNESRLVKPICQCLFSILEFDPWEIVSRLRKGSRLRKQGGANPFWSTLFHGLLRVSYFCGKSTLHDHHQREIREKSSLECNWAKNGVDQFYRFAMGDIFLGKMLFGLPIHQRHGKT